VQACASTPFILASLRSLKGAIARRSCRRGGARRPRAKCRRGRACEDAAACGGRLADWADSVKTAARRDPTYAPEADAIDSAKRLETLARSRDKEGVC
jgi:hypothetical protein